MTLPGPAGDPSLGAAADIAAALQTDTEQGLDAAEAARRLAAEGPNTLRSTPPPAAWRRLLAQFHDPLVYLLLGAVAVALGAWAFEGRIGWPVDATVIALIVVLNAALGYFHEARAANAVAALARMTAVTSAPTCASTKPL
jgi:Ca2+-transporting ATPase